MSADDLAKMRRQAILSRHAALDGLGFPRLCRVPGKAKVVFPTRATAETARDEIVADEPDSGPMYAYMCRDHFHLTSTPPRSHTVPAERKAS